jgi:hypothetical protein
LDDDAKQLDDDAEYFVDPAEWFDGKEVPNTAKIRVQIKSR